MRSGSGDGGLQARRGSAPGRGPGAGRVHSGGGRVVPGGGAKRPPTVWTNYFRLQVGLPEIFQYSLQIQRHGGGAHGLISKRTARLVQQKLIEEHFGAAPPPVYDGAGLLYTAQPLPTSVLDIHFQVCIIDTDDHRQNFNVIIKPTSVLVVEEWRNSVDQCGALLQALNVVLREKPARELYPVGTDSFFERSSSSSSSSTEALQLRHGFSQSVRTLSDHHLALNFDISSAFFFPQQPLRVHQFLTTHLSLDSPWTSDQRKQVTRILSGVRILAIHHIPPRKYTIRGLSDDPTHTLTFIKDHSPISILTYYKNTYNRNLEYPKLPCLQVGGSNQQNVFLPMELCEICADQKYTGHLLNNLRAQLRKTTSERKAGIENLINGSSSPAGGLFVETFRINVNRQMTEVPIRMLKAPVLKYRNRQLQISPNAPGSWSVPNGAQFLEACTTSTIAWALVNFDRTPERDIQMFVQKLSSRCQELGMQMQRNPVKFLPFSDLETLRDELQRLKDMPPPLFVLCVIKDRSEHYAALKKLADVDVGIITQCCSVRHVKSSKENPQYLTNLALKLNAKLGGRNVGLVCEIPQICSVLKEPTIIFGADVTHPFKNRVDKMPSIAAVVASSDWPSASRYAARLSAQEATKEIIKDLEQMVKELWFNFHRKQQCKPKNVLFFRDGVGEGQFKEVVEDELHQLEKALRAAGGEGYDPSVTMIVVQKRHHTFLFPENSPNVAPGTVVEQVITHPLNTDFYICSHAAVGQNTNKPRHYHVLRDRIEFSYNQLQTLIYHLCHTYARCTKSVSIVPAVYYAHLAAFRGRLYLDAQAGHGVPRLHRDVEDSMFFI